MRLTNADCRSAGRVHVRVRGAALAAALVLAGCAEFAKVPGEPAAAATPAPDATAAATKPAVPPVSSVVPSAAQAAAPSPIVQPPPPPPPPPPIVPYAEAVVNAANALLGAAVQGSRSPGRIPLIVDPLVDGMTGAQTVATESMGEQIVRLVREKYPQFEVERFTAASVSRQPYVLIGTFTPVNAQRQTSGVREAYRICLALADLKTGKVVSKGLAFAQMHGVDATPTRFFTEMPAWTEDPATLGYIRTCQGTRAGDPINALYADRIIAAALLSDAMEAYNAGRFREARDLYLSAKRTPGGDQFRTYSGLYMAHLKLGQRDAAMQAFGEMIDYGLKTKRLGVKFLFRPGSTAFVRDTKVSGIYPVWIKEIAARAHRQEACLEVVGHTSPTGPEPLNQRLSLLRAETIRDRLLAETPSLKNRTIANGVGSTATLVGTGKDDASDALDRRVEFKIVGC